MSIVDFFLRHRAEESIWGTIVAPALGGFGLAIGLVLMVANYTTLTGSDLTWINSLPWALPLAAATGALASGRKVPRHTAEHQAAAPLP